MSKQRTANELGSRLRMLRMQTATSTYELAEATGFSQSKVSRLENGRAYASVADVSTIALALNARPVVVARLVALAEQLALPDYMVSPRRLPRAADRLQQRQAMEMMRSVKSVFLMTGLFMPSFAQTPEYASYAWRANPMIDVREDEFVSDRLKLGAMFYGRGQDRVAIVDRRTLLCNTLPPDLWREQLSVLLWRLRTVQCEFGVLADNQPFRDMTTILGNDAAIRESETDWHFHATSPSDLVDKAQLMHDAVWDGEAVAVVEDSLHEFELSVDLREPQRYFEA